MVTFDSATIEQEIHSFSIYERNIGKRGKKNFRERDRNKSKVKTDSHRFNEVENGRICKKKHKTSVNGEFPSSHLSTMEMQILKFITGCRINQLTLPGVKSGDVYYFFLFFCRGRCLASEPFF